MSYEQKDKILKGFVLSSDSLFEIRRLMERRPRSRFSEGLSSEAKLAMEQTREDTLLMFDGYDDTTVATDDDVNDSLDKQSSKKRVQSSKKKPSKGNVKTSKKQISFSEKTYEDNLDKPKKPSVVEIDKNETDISNNKFKTTIDKTAEQNSVDKCKDWIEDNDIECNTGKQDDISGSVSPALEYRLSSTERKQE